MIKRDVSAARNYLAESAVFGEKRIPVSAFDYGDEKTVLLHLKRVGSSIGDLNEDNYGIYLGKHNDGYVVAVKDFMGSGLTSCEVFDTESEMKTIWQLD
jgi:hypothetical protein